MAFKLTTQDKLAIMLTSAGSQRKLAAAIGISHQKLGRWLREGQPPIIDPETGEILKQAGAKKIPDDEATRAGINFAWSLHKEVTRQQAQAHGLPYDSRIPIFIERRTLRNGKLGDRVFAENTEYIRSEVRMNFLGLMHDSESIVQTSIRSTINIFSYTNSTGEPNPYATESIRQRRYKKDSVFESGEDIIRHGGTVIPLFTKYENMMPGTEMRRSVYGVERKLKAHEPHATHLADQYLFQLIPATYYETPAPTPAKRAAKRKRRNKRGK